MCDELFDDLAPEEKTGERLWLKTSIAVQQEGYRKGHSAGEELSLQEGFNQGFSCSTRALFSIAELRGEIGGILSLNLMKNNTLDKSTESKLKELLGDVVLYETEMLTFNKTVFENLKFNRVSYQLEKGDEDEINRESDKTEQAYKGEDHGDYGNSDLKLEQFKERLKQLVQTGG